MDMFSMLQSKLKKKSGGGSKGAGVAGAKSKSKIKAPKVATKPARIKKPKVKKTVPPLANFTKARGRPSEKY